MAELNQLLPFAAKSTVSYFILFKHRKLDKIYQFIKSAVFSLPKNGNNV